MPQLFQNYWKVRSTVNRELTASYQWCWGIVRRSGSSFYRSFFLLPQPARDSMAAWYAFARLTDDLGDDESDELDKRVQLERWRLRVAHIVRHGWNRESGGDHYDMLWPALVDTVEKFQIPTNLLDEIVVGVQMDVGQVAIADWNQLFDYCYHVASTVGIACTYIWNASRSLPAQIAIDCGIAFQLTNVLRDLREDALRGRIYIPATELKRFGCHTEAWLSGHPDGDWQGCVESIAQRAWGFYATGWRTADYLPSDSQRMFSLIWRTYCSLLNQVVESKERLWSGERISVRRTAQLRLAMSHFLPWWYRCLPAPSLIRFAETEMAHEHSARR